ncbi:MAG TPA: acyl-ACP desaturase, partial [Acidimicrobiales bacterium]|nr:acyl-ACP desaturase [Acidimicrobiales bacterium]
IVIRDYLTVTRMVDPIALERARMAQVCGASVPHPVSVMDGLAYVALQELATRVAHHNTGKAMDDTAGYEVMKRVAADENLHHLFYRDLVIAALEVDPSSAVMALERQVAGFAMPGTGIIGFRRHAAAIARQRIYDLEIHYESILRPMFARHWNVDGLEGLSPEAEESRCRLKAALDAADRAARRWSERSAAKASVAASA